MTHNRRDVLRAVGAAGIAGGIAGCLGGGGGGSQAETTAEPTTAATTESDDGSMGDGDDGSMDGDAPTVEVTEHDEHGEILVDGDGMTLYLFTNDSDGESACYDSCAETWPPLLVDGEPTAGDGLPMDLATTERDDGSTQVVYDGWPLYYYVSDTDPGDATGQGVNDVWFVVYPEDNDPMGGEEEETAETDPTTTATGGYGGDY